MPDVTIKPATSMDESGNVKFPDYGRPGKLIPAYLVSLRTPPNVKGEAEYFIATKFDTEFSVCGKFTGFFFEGDIDTVIARHSEIIEATPATNFVEIMFPWDKIQYIRSLVYRHKLTGEKK
jgi:hypothetical protein